jgi:hypothetical protein
MYVMESVALRLALVEGLRLHSGRLMTTVHSITGSA